MIDHDDEIDVGDNDEIDDADDERVSVDPVAAAIAFTNLVAEFSKAYKLVTTDKAKAARLREVAKLDRRVANTEQKFVAITAQAEQVQAALDVRAAAADERDRVFDARTTAFESSLQEARDHLRAYYDSIAEADRHVRYRVLSHAGLLSGYNPELQDLPTWDQLKRLVVGLPDDPPSLEREVVSHPRIDIFSDTSDDPHADRQGAPFLGELTRDVSHKRKSAA
jgi:hypothetical protein